MFISPARALKHLNDLGSVEAIANRLRSHGIPLACTDPVASRSCPIANYLKLVTGRKAWVGPAWTVTSRNPGRFIALPPLVKSFVADFDLAHFFS